MFSLGEIVVAGFLLGILAPLMLVAWQGYKFFLQLIEEIINRW